MNDRGAFERDHYIEHERRRAIGVALDALTLTRALHDSLGAAGEEIVQKNRFDETALRIDVESEQAIIDALRASGLPVKVFSEEHGTVDLSEHPEYTAIIDGLDGTKTYREQRGTGRYGTMLGLYEGGTPRYADYLFGGVAEHGLDRLIFATRGGGAFIRHKEQDTPARTSGVQTIDGRTSFGVDEYFKFNRELYLPVLGHQRQIRNFSAESRYVDVATGQADLALECSRKGNLEIASSYGIIREAGGAIVDGNGQDIGPQRYETFGQDAQVPIITAATPELAAQMVELLRQHHRG